MSWGGAKHREHRCAVGVAKALESEPAKQRNERVGGVGIARDERGDQRQRLTRRQAARRRGNLATDFSIRFVGRETRQGDGEVVGELLAVAQQTNRPGTH